jgi:hypothetical protein
MQQTSRSRKQAELALTSSASSMTMKMEVICPSETLGYSVTTHSTELFIVTNVRTSNPTNKDQFSKISVGDRIH